MEQPRLSIILVNYKSGHLVYNCLSSLYQHNPTLGYEIFVVDNQSDDGSESMIKSAFPDIQWIQMGYNAGFARANNAALKLAKGEAILLLNSDTLLEDNAIEKCLQYFISSEYVACGVQLLNLDRSPQISGNFVMKGGLNYLLPLPFLGNFLRKIALSAGVKKTNIAEAVKAEEVDWINGAYLMVRRNILSKSGILDEDFFLYAEEAEWCSRLKKFGKLCIYGDLNVIHLQGETSNEFFESEGLGYQNIFDKKGLQILVSTLLRIRKEFGIVWFLVLLFFHLVEIPIFFIGVLILKLFGSKRYTFTQVGNYCSHMMKILSLTPQILSGKPYFYKVL